MSMIHLEIKEGTKTVACGMRRGLMMGMRTASHWVKIEDAKHIECKRCKEIAANRMFKETKL